MLRDLPVRSAQFRYGVFLPSATGFARQMERALPSRLPVGAFMVVAGEVAPLFSSNLLYPRNPPQVCVKKPGR